LGENISVFKRVRNPAETAVAQIADQSRGVIPQEPDFAQIEGAEMAEVVGEVQFVAKGQVASVISAAAGLKVTVCS
jgi:hypothetical protein